MKSRPNIQAFNLTAAFGALLLAAPVHAQDNATVGSPLLRDFDLDGRTVAPPAPAPPVQTPQPVPAETRAAEPAAPAPAPRQPVRTAPSTAPAAQAPSISDYLTAAPRPQPLDIPAEVTSAPVESLPQAAPLPQTAAPIAKPAFPIYWAVLAMAVAALAGLLLFQRRRKAALAGAHESAVARAALPEAAPAPAPILHTVDTNLRPWLELEFTPERLVATANDATVHFDLLVRNVGKSPARNVRIQARMFNPNANQPEDIKAFFATPVGSASPMNVPPQHAAKFRSSVVMPRDKVREIEIGGRPLFIPTVAINILYEYADGRTGQTSKSYVIGTEKAEAAEKMGPFRLDLGPRIYRQVGGRPLDLARAV